MSDIGGCRLTWPWYVLFAVAYCLPEHNVSPALRDRHDQTLVAQHFDCSPRGVARPDRERAGDAQLDRKPRVDTAPGRTAEGGAERQGGLEGRNGEETRSRCDRKRRLCAHQRLLCLADASHFTPARTCYDSAAQSNQGRTS